MTAGAELESNGPGEAPILLWCVMLELTARIVCLLEKRDIRNPKATILKLMESHTDTITEVSSLGLRFQSLTPPSSKYATLGSQFFSPHPPMA